MPDTSSRQKTSRHALDQPVGRGPFTFPTGHDVVITGWAFLEPAGTTLPQAAIEVVSLRTGATTRLLPERFPRPDVSAHFGADHLLMSGFTTAFRIDHRVRGAHSVRLLQNEGSQTHTAVDLFTFTTPPDPSEANVRAELATRFLQGAGLEIGALQRRLEVPGHCSVTYVDRMPLEDLWAHYPELIGQPLQKPDLIDDGETLTTVPSLSQDFVIANHFIEHCENPVQTLLNIGRVLREGGILYMAVPDKRFTFDIDRPVTQLAVLADTFRRGRRGDRDALYAEWSTNVMRTPPAEADAVARKLLNEKYSIHFNVWALPDLLDFLSWCRAQFNLPFTLEWVVSSDNEVVLILRKQSRDPGDPIAWS